jgi:hypothetical protein
MEGCIDNLDCYNNRRIFKLLTLNETVETFVKGEYKLTEGKLKQANLT